MIKHLGKAFLCSILERQVRHLREHNNFKIIAVGGSVGKTSTKLAIAKTLSVDQRVIYQNGNYNDRLTVPLVLFGEVQPGIFNIFAWLSLIRRTKRQSKQDYPYDIAVLEIGTDAPGQMEQFAYLKPDIYVLSAVAPEHMMHFKDIDAVGAEELQPVKFSAKSIINIDDVPHKYLPSEHFSSYGFDPLAHYKVIKSDPLGLTGQRLTIGLAATNLSVEVSALGEQGAKLVLAAAAVADQLGVSKQEIAKDLQAITPVSGRMQILSGSNSSMLIDDTYNSSPIAVKAALDVLYGTDSPQRVAILGGMNEMGADAPLMHAEVGAYCDSKKLNLVITIGKDAENYLAPSAQKAGCEVVSFASPYEAGAYVKQNLKKGAVVLAKGSQNGVFAEEALKPLLANQTDASKLVRQSLYWQAVKKNQFSA